MEVVRIPIDELDDSFQIRVKTREEKIEQYANYFMEQNGWGGFPPIDVVIKSGRKMIADGIHRYRAAKLAGFADVPCVLVNAGDDDWELLELSVEKNGVQGIDMDEKDWHKFRRLILEKLSRGEIRNRPYSALAQLGKCQPSTMTRLRDKMKEEGWTFPDTATGADGKEYPTTYQKPAFAHAKPEISTPTQFCAREGCGVPIWEENKNDPNYTYTERNGQWFCSEECAEQWEQERLSDEAEALTGIPDELPDIPSAALPTHEEDEPEPVKHEAEPALTEDEENEAIAEDLAFHLKNFRPQRINSILIIFLFKKLKLTLKNITNITTARRSKNDELPEEEKTGFKWKLNDGSEWELSKSDMEDLRPLYPAIDFEQELRKSIGWSLTNPKNRKTKSGILKHINSWLTNAQNKATRSDGHAGRKSCYVSRDAGLDFENLEY